MVESIIGTIVAFLSIFGVSFAIEKSPIKINPLKMMKNFLVGDIIKEVKDTNLKVDKIQENVNENEKDRIRETILRYKKGMDNGISLGEHDFEYILKIYDKYKKELHGNSFVTEVVDEIKAKYKEQLKNK